MNVRRKRKQLQRGLAGEISRIRARRGKAVTVRQLVEAYVAAMPHRAVDLSCLRKWLPIIGEVNAWDLLPEQIEPVVDALIENDYAPSTINREVGALASAYKWAKLERLTPSKFSSPTRGIPKLPTRPRVVEISEAEISQLRRLAVLSRAFRFPLFVSLLIDTGCRKSELTRRHWKDFDLVKRTIHIPETKTGVQRWVHFSSESAKLLRAEAARASDPEHLVFHGWDPTQPADYRKPWENLRERIGRPDLHMHDIRHHAAQRLLAAGVTMEKAAQMLGHSVQVLERNYGHLKKEKLGDEAQKAWAAAARSK